MGLLDWILGRRRKQSASAAPAVAEALRAAAGRIERLPMLPAAAAQALAAARTPDVSLEHLGRVIERDPTLASNVLRLANSARHRTAVPSRTLYEAVVKLGTRECHNLILTASMRNLFRNLPPQQQATQERLWHHALLTACACRQLDVRLRLGHHGEEFTCGLTHDIGRVLIAVGAPEQFAAADPVDFAEGPDLLAREQAALGTDHCEVGAWFAGANALPEPVVECVQSHHAPAEAAGHHGLVALVAAADHMANFYQRENDVEGYDPATNPHWPLLAAHARKEESALLAAAPAALAAAVEEAAEMGGAPPQGPAAPPRRPRRRLAPEPRSGPERRVATRFAHELKATCRLLGRAGAPWSATVEDISRTGLGLWLGVEVRQGALLSVSLEGVGDRFTRPLLARVMNARSRPSGQWRLGCALVKPMTDEEVQALMLARTAEAGGI